jgi:modulator of FtsH protease HflK
VEKLVSREASGAEYPQYENTTLDPVIHGYTLTEDFNVIQGRFALRYRVEQPALHVTAGGDVPRLLERLAMRALSIQLAARPIDASLTEQRQELAAAAARDVQSRSDALRIGIRVSGVDIVELSPPAQVLTSFEDVVNARQFAKTMMENSRQYHAETVTKSQGEAAAILHRAESYGAGMVSAAGGEAVSFSVLLAEYQREPDLVARRLLRETLDTVMGQIYSRTLLPAGGVAPSLLLEPSPEFAR